MPKTNKNAEAYLKMLLTNSVVAADTPAGPDVYDHFGAGTALLKSVTAGNFYFSLHTGSPGATGTPATNEIAYTGYARVIMARGTASIWTFGTPGDGFGATASNTAAVTFGKMTGGAGGLARFWGLGLNATPASGAADELMWYGPLALETARPYTVESAGVTNNDITVPSHNYSAGDQIAFVDVPGGAVPAATPALNETAYFFVIAAGLATHTFRVSDTLGGSAVDITGVGSGYLAKVLEKNITLNDEPKIDVGAAIILER